jgi:ankyrin repeat protein
MVDTTALYRAFDECDVERINSFVAAHGVNWVTDGDNWNLLHMALLSVSEAPRADVVRRLIGLGVDVNARDRRRWTPLQFAARSRTPAVVKLLIDAGAQIDAEDDEGITPLHRSVMGKPRNLEAIEQLLAAGARTESARKYIAAIASQDKGALLKLLVKYDRSCSVGPATEGAEPGAAADGGA